MQDAAPWLAPAVLRGESAGGRATWGPVPGSPYFKTAQTGSQVGPRQLQPQSQPPVPPRSVGAVAVTVCLRIFYLKTEGHMSVKPKAFF